MSKHTPGPWVVDQHKNVMAGSGLVAFPGVSAGFNQEANARLIACAPELLEAMKKTLDEAIGWYEESRGQIPKDTPWLNEAQAIIAKAEGDE